MTHKKLLICLGAAVTSALAPSALASSVEDPWLIRVRGLAVLPDASAEIETIGGVLKLAINMCQSLISLISLRKTLLRN